MRRRRSKGSALRAVSDELGITTPKQAKRPTRNVSRLKAKKARRTG